MSMGDSELKGGGGGGWWWAGQVPRACWLGGGVLADAEPFTVAYRLVHKYLLALFVCFFFFFPFFFLPFLFFLFLWVCLWKLLRM